MNARWAERTLLSSFGYHVLGIATLLRSISFCIGQNILMHYDMVAFYDTLCVLRLTFILVLLVVTFVMIRELRPFMSFCARIALTHELVNLFFLASSLHVKTIKPSSL